MRVAVSAASGLIGSALAADLAADGAEVIRLLRRPPHGPAGPARAGGIRVVSFRSGVGLAARGGMLGPLLPPFRLGLGARIGSGEQYLSWISLTDEVRAIRFLLGDEGAAGAFNLTAPEPVT